ncbi:MAG: GumC family protein [Methylotenera sp.]
MENQANQAVAPHPMQQPEDDEINLMELLLVIAKHNRFILKLTVFVAVLALAVSLLLPNIYTGKTVILPPQQGASTASMLLGQLGGLAGAAGGALGIKNPGDLYVGMLKSRTVADALIQRFKLQALYEQKTMSATRAALEAAASFTSGKDGFITVEFSDKDPQLAASIANAYVEELDRLTQTLAVTEAAQRRLFFEKQLKNAKEALATAEVALKETQERTGLIQLDKQGEAIIEAVADLRAQVAAKEVELTAMRAYATAQNPDYRQLREVLTGLRAQLAKVERNNVAGQGDVMVPTGKIPEAGLEYMRKMREVKYQETLFELLSKQFEIAKIDEAKEAATIQVVDKALPPERKSKPKRALMVLLFTIMAFFIGILFAFFREASERASQDPESAARMHLLRRYLFKGR